MPDFQHLIQTGAVDDILVGASVLIAIGFLIQAAVVFKRHLDDPRAIRLSAPMGLMAVSLCLFSLPSLMKASSERAPEAREIAAKASGPHENSSEEASSEEVAALATVSKASAPTENASKEASSEEVAAWGSAKAGLSAESFALAEKTTVRELEAKGLGLSAPAASQGVGDGGALAWVLSSLLALGVAGGAWARGVSQRIRREKEAQAMPRVDLNASREP